MKFSPLKCGFCGQQIVVGQMAQIITEDDGYQSVIHSANRHEFVDPQNPKNKGKISCMEAKKRGWI